MSSVINLDLFWKLLLFYNDQVVKVEKGWVEQEFVLFIIAALPSEVRLPNE